MRMKIEGSADCRFDVAFFVRVIGGKGKLACANIFRVDSLLEAYKIVDKFFKVRSKIPTSSRYLFGGHFPENSLEWLACQHCVIKIWDFAVAFEDRLVERIEVLHPYMEKIDKSVN